MESNNFLNTSIIDNLEDIKKYIDTLNALFKLYNMPKLELISDKLDEGGSIILNNGVFVVNICKFKSENKNDMPLEYFRSIGFFSHIRPMIVALIMQLIFIAETQINKRMNFLIEEDIDLNKLKEEEKNNENDGERNK